MKYKKVQFESLPSTPVTPRPSTMFCVSLNGTLSGVSNVFPCKTKYSCTMWSVINNNRTLTDLLEQAVEINVNDITGVGIKKNVLAMSISEPKVAPR
jgi:hypothetical protein